MKTQTIDPTQFDGEKFAARYSLDFSEFRLVGTTLHYPDSLPDSAADPGGDDAPDSAPTRPDDAFTAIGAGTATLAQVQEAIKYFCQTVLKGT